MSRTNHWDGVYDARSEENLTWFEACPELSLDLIGTYASPKGAVIDIGAGTSRLVDHLLARGYPDISVLDLSQAALDVARARLGADAGRIRWIAADITTWRATRACAVWHDRAVFHFLTGDADRAGYIAAMQGALAPGGHAIIATFAEDGPESCSGLPVVRYTPDTLMAALQHHAPGCFKAVESRRFSHVTPKGNQQKFQVSVFRVSG